MTSNICAYAFIHGNIVPIEQANVPITTNALHYGAAVFGGIKAYETSQGIGIFRLDDHLRRLAQSSKILRFAYDFDHQAIKSAIVELARKNQLQGTTYIRPLIYRSDSMLSPGIKGDYDLLVYMAPMESNQSAGDGLSVMVSSWRRNSDNSLPPRTKAAGGYLNSSLAIHDAQTAGFDSAIFLDESGHVSEGAVMNLFVVKDGALITPAVDADILEGITRRTIIELAEAAGIPVVQRPIIRTELYSADELFFTGTAVEVAWCRAVDGVRVSESAGPITRKLHAAFYDLANTHPDLFTAIDA